MKLRVIGALQLPEVLDGSKGFRLPVPVRGTDHEITDHNLPSQTIGVDPVPKKASHCARIYEPRAVEPSYLSAEALFLLRRLFGEGRRIDAPKKGNPA